MDEKNKMLVNLDGQLPEDLCQVMNAIIHYVFLKDPKAPKAPKVPEKTEHKKRHSVGQILDCIFRSADPKSDIVLSRILDKTLVDPIINTLKTIERDGLRGDWRNPLEDLRQWEEKKDLILLAKAFGAVRDAVIIDLKTRELYKSNNESLYTVCEVIRDYCTVEKEKFNSIKYHLLLVQHREKLAERQKLDSASFEDFYALGRVEFACGYPIKTEEAFQKASEILPPEDLRKKDYHLSLGLVQHYSWKWKEAGENYQISLNMMARDLKEFLSLIENLDPEEKKRLHTIHLLKKRLTSDLIEKLRD